MLYDLLMFFMNFFLLVICVLMSVAFLTLLERSILGYIQVRKGPNKVGLMGILQPFSDAVKLVCKEQPIPFMSNYLFYYLSPVFNLMISLLVWLVFPYLTYMCSFLYGFLFFLCCTSLSVYTVMIAGWSSNSNYSLLGSLRSVAQTISYEVSLALILLSLIFLVGSLNMLDFMNYQFYCWFIIISFPLFLCCFASCLAETNRTPFDFAEGESELVSGFNIEYGAGGFTLIFLSEYTSILFMSMLMSLIFLGGDIYSYVFFMKLSTLSFSFVWIRGTLPRFRYDKLMYLAWKSFLPLSLNFLLFYIGVKILLISIN
uniref:NADH-ubiquinone oxidoreductase chain 1 n=1 Tax=Apalacris nigrogeniculata TaxID=335052 RepID=A0A6G6A6Z0_9ORTH|nr:NADH dehydrogenase subunit 1 [Apalacris nigrogeniculata]YP_010703648.1 NADH dehydrogenase subunit 1 [Xenocatantops humilis]QID03459.1 NADH dehydrogenase subunit 1 [Apalacris nigrogeniculata]WCO86782.1 NADH dehydrogenase subunit 1 [Xenocatantops humilis]